MRFRLHHCSHARGPATVLMVRVHVLCDRLVAPPFRCENTATGPHGCVLCKRGGEEYVPVENESLHVGVRGSHPFAENAKEWGTRLNARFGSPFIVLDKPLGSVLKDEDVVYQPTQSIPIKGELQKLREVVESFDKKCEG